MNNNGIANRIYSKNTIKKTVKKAKLFGINNTLNPIVFLNFRLVTSILIFILLLFVPNGYIYSPVFTIIYYYLVYYIVIDNKLKIRTRLLEEEALQFFEVLALSIETGKDLKSALEITCNNIDSELSLEFKQTIKETNYSKSLGEALKSMRKRIPSDDINNIILNISETSIYGGEIVDTIYREIEFLNDKKIQNVRAEIAKLPIKHSIISTLFFLPLILLLVLGPVILNLILGS